MNKYHKELLDELKKHAGSCTKEQLEKLQRYMGTNKHCYYIKSGVREKIIKDWIKKHRDLNYEELIELLNSLYKGKSHDELLIGGKFLELLPKLRKNLDPIVLDKWLNTTVGWGEVDTLCQSNFSPEEILSKWNKWEKIIRQFSKDKNIHKRRASLVLLVKSVGHSSDERLLNLSFQLIDQLSHEKDILITKAISWLLRSMISNHKEKVSKYIQEHKSLLPTIAMRETERKLLTGKKYIRPVK